MLAVAIDVQGAAKARPYVEQAQATYPNAVDADHQLCEIFGFKAVPNAVFADEAGIIRYANFGGFDIRKAEYRQLAEGFAYSPNLTRFEHQVDSPGGFESAEALEHFRKGLRLYRQGDTPAALAAWRQGVALEPDNWIIRKQIWAIENPDKFYQGDVDFEWQKAQIAGNR